MQHSVWTKRQIGLAILLTLILCSLPTQAQQKNDTPSQKPGGFFQRPGIRQPSPPEENQEEEEQEEVEAESEVEADESEVDPRTSAAGTPASSKDGL